MKTVWLFSDTGILDQQAQPVPGVPFQNPVTAGAPHQHQLSVIVDGHQIWTHQDSRWEQVISAEIQLRCLCWTAEGRLLVGTAEARVAEVENGQLNFLTSFDNIPERQLWKTPWGGPPDLRSFAIARDGAIYANIHVGWIARSKDSGQTWQNLKQGLEMDVHQVAAHPHEMTTVFAATASGFYFSQDQGQTFTRSGQEMPSHYQRSCAVFPEGEVYLTSTSRGPHGSAEARLYRSQDSGQNWTQVEGLPDQIDRNIDTFQISIINEATALVVIEDNQLYQTTDLGYHWQKIDQQFPRLYGGLVVNEG